MSLLPIFQWLVHAPEFTWVRDSKWGFAVVEMVHLVALAGLRGAVLLADLGVLGVGLRRRDLARQLSPVFAWSLIVMVISGALLIAAEPMKCYYHPAFRLKMVLLAIAVVFAFTVRPAGGGVEACCSFVAIALAQRRAGRARDWVLMKAALLLILVFAGDDATRHKEWMDDAQDLKEDLREGLQAKSRAQERPRQNRRYGSHRCDGRILVPSND
jgi:hypothetical protein